MSDSESIKLFDNRVQIVKDDLVKTMTPHSRVSVAAAYFSIYAFQELREQLGQIDEFRFVFTSPTFIEKKEDKAKREFYIPRLNRERGIYGSEFEVRLRNELTQKAIARECADWIRAKAKFRSNCTQETIPGFLNIENGDNRLTYAPLDGFTTVDLGCERGSTAYCIINRFSAPVSDHYLRLFSDVWNDKKRLQDVTEMVVDQIAAVYQENPAELIYFMTLSIIFGEFLEDISEDTLPNERTGFQESLIWQKLYNFQRDAALAIINKLEMFNGCILADSVGLGKTYTALAVMKYYECRNKNVLVLCPKKLMNNWMTFRGNLVNNPLAKDRLRYDVLFHTDLSRERGTSAIGLPLDQIDWGNYDLVVIDESHNFRNGGNFIGESNDRENRYLTLMNKVIRAGVKTKVLMLSATPVNNRFVDLRNQLALAYEGDAEKINNILNTKSDIETIFRTAQKVFNAWSKEPAKDRTTQSLLNRLDYDFFEVLDQVTIARSRKHIQKYYDTSKIGAFPKRRPPLSYRPHLTDLQNAVNYKEIYALLDNLMLTVYTPSSFLLPSRTAKYFDKDDPHQKNLFVEGREKGIRRLMSINLLKRLESSAYSFRTTLERVRQYINDAMDRIRSHQAGSENSSEFEAREVVIGDFDDDDQNIDFLNVGRKFKINLADMDYISWLRDLESDSENLSLLLSMVADITPEHDAKLARLLTIIDEKLKNPPTPGNRKILIFTAYSDTAEYLYKHVSWYVKNRYALDSALVTGNIEGRTTLPKFRTELNRILTFFSPVSKEKSLLYPKNDEVIDVLIATDCISEGQNLQDCDFCVNYDIHWNPVRIIQRFGRIDRIGSRNSEIQLVNFWPDIELDEYIQLKSRVETRMRISVLTSTGDDDLLNQEEKGDLEYRRVQLERLQKEVVDLEDISSGISIMDLGLNDFRMDLLAYVKEHRELDRVPFGIHAVVRGETPGVIFVLKNVNQSVNIGSRNRLHPFYLVFVGEDGTIEFNHLQPKEALETMRYLSRGRSTPDADACRLFNAETKDGRDMSGVSRLLRSAIASIIQVKEESDVGSFFSEGKTTFLSERFSGLNDFELLCFMAVKPK